MNQEKIKNIIEAALMVSDKPMSIAQLTALFEKNAEVEKELIREVIKQLQQDYENRGIELREVASGFRIQVSPDYAEWVNRLFEDKPPRYSRALLETLAIIAYRQPLTRAEIEDIRGVSVSTGIIKTLQEREWIRVVGHKDVPGKPELLATTKEFLDYFNLKKLSDLPTLAEIKELTRLNPDLFDNLEIPDAGIQPAHTADTTFTDDNEIETGSFDEDDSENISVVTDEENNVIQLKH